MKPDIISLFILISNMIFIGNVFAQNSDKNKYEFFQINELIKQREDLGITYLRFLDKASLSMGLYALPSEGEDKQQPHKLDEIYYIVKGKASLLAGDAEISVQPGTIAFVKAEVDHKFVNIEEDLQVLVIFSKTPFSPNDPDQKSWELKEVTAEKKPDENVWNQFLEVSTLRFGAYLLPEEMDGDKTLTHDVDEVNIVVNGNAKFHLDDERINVKPGSIVYVEKGVGHYFDELEGDFEVLIMFVK